MIVKPLTAKQRTAIVCSRAHKITVYEGAVRSSKTITSLLDWIEYVRSAPPGPLLMVGKTERTLERNVIGPLTDMLGTARCKLTRGTGELHLLGRTVLVAGANDERAQDKIRGLTLAGAYVDELTIVPESFWSMLLTRLSVAGSRVFATTNPDSPQHWLKVKFLDRAATHLTAAGDVTRPNGAYDPKAHDGPLDLARLTFVIDDNPTLDPEYRAFIESTYVGLWRKRFIEGLWVAAEGAVYDMLDLDVDGRHRATWRDVRSTLAGRWWVGIDYGTANPTHAVLLGLGRRPDQRPALFVCGEWRHDGRAQRTLTDAQQSRELRGWLQAGAGVPDAVDVWPERTAVDPAAASFRTQLRHDGWSGLVNADNPVLDGIRRTSSLLSSGRLLFLADEQGAPAAPHLERELLGYVWDEKAQAKGEDVPVKADDHGPDGLRYGVQVTRSVWRSWITDTDDDAAAA